MKGQDKIESVRSSASQGKEEVKSASVAVSKSEVDDGDS